MENWRSYEEIEPSCKWKKDEYEEVLEIRLQGGFRKEQLRVEINSSGVLTISRDCPEDGSRRFHKEVMVHPDCQREKIHAKVSGGNLYITMPKRIPIVIPQTQPIQADQQIQENRKPKQNVDKDKLLDAALSMLPKPIKCISGLKSAVLWRQMGGKTTLKLGALAAVVVAPAVGAYVAYKYR